MKTFRAPWSRSLKAMSIFATLLCLAIAFCPHTAATPANAPFFWLRGLPVILLLITPFFTVRGYTVGPTAILIHRLVWSTPLPLADLVSARVEPDCLSQALRLWGNGGLYAFTGIYTNHASGRFRAFVTDGRRTVVLRFAHRTVVLSPDDPEDFVQTVSGHCR